MIVYNVATKVLDTESFPQHNIACLIYGITYIVLLRWEEINTHTHTHTHTHTKHARTHRHVSTKVIGNMLAGKIKIPRQGDIRACRELIRADEGRIRAGQ